jgi:hypothetical protein
VSLRSPLAHSSSLAGWLGLAGFLLPRFPRRGRLAVVTVLLLLGLSAAPAPPLTVVAEPPASRLMYLTPSPSFSTVGSPASGFSARRLLSPSGCA